MSVSTFDDHLSGLSELSRQQLVESWHSLLDCDPPKGISMEFMGRAIAHEMHVKHFGSLKPAVARRLEMIAGGKARDKGRGVQRAAALDPGARLFREWNGATHVVDVTDDGFGWKGETYGSLSAIAREITGARWSGPRFFGLTGKAAS